MKSMLKKISKKFGGNEEGVDGQPMYNQQPTSHQPSSGLNPTTNGQFINAQQQRTPLTNTNNSISTGTQNSSQPTSQPVTKKIISTNGGQTITINNSNNSNGLAQQPRTASGDKAADSTTVINSQKTRIIKTNAQPRRNNADGNDETIAPSTDSTTSNDNYTNSMKGNSVSNVTGGMNSITINPGNNSNAAAASAASIPSNSSSNGLSSITNNSTAGTNSGTGNLTKADLLKPIATLADTPASNRPTLLVHKLKLCSILFDWTMVDENPMSRDNKAREAKRQQLLELVEYIGKNKNIYTDAVLSALMHMVTVNLFRALPARQNESVANKQGGGEGDEDEVVFDPAWPHLQIVYELFLRFIVGSEVDMKVLKRWINSTFIVRLLDLFDSEDHRERDYLKTILHRIYAKFMSLRAFIRKAINHVFFVFVYESDRQQHQGISELLEILGSIINGFALPLKAEHKTFLQRVLLPLHAARSLSTFHQQLAYCVAQFVDKDPSLGASVCTHLIKYWPHQAAQKQLLFLNELEELLELCQPDQFKQVAELLSRRLAASIASPHFQVAERALFLWHNEYVANLLADHRSIVLPVLYPTLYTNSQPPFKEKSAQATEANGEAAATSSPPAVSTRDPNQVYGHWNPTVNSLTANVLKIFAELDQPLVDECARQYTEQRAKQKQEQKQREEAWQQIDLHAKQHPLADKLQLLLPPVQTEIQVG